MIRSLLARSQRPLVLAAALSVGCADDDDRTQITGPELPAAEGRLYRIQEVTFPTVDEVPVAASYVRASEETRPVVILIHGLGDPLARLEWVLSDRFPAILEAGYHALAIDLRGHGETPLPDDGRPAGQLTYSDLEEMHLEVGAAISWLRGQPTADKARIGVIGVGLGASVAFVSMGAFADDLRAGVALSPGLWDPDLQPVVIGGDISPFAPHTILYLVGGADTLTLGNTVIVMWQWASALAENTPESSLHIVEGSSAYGFELLNTPGVMQRILDWLQAHL